MCRSTEGSTWGGRGVRQAAVSTIRLGTYNIRNSRNGGLDSELRGMSQANIDLGIFQETKVTAGIHTRESSGYRVVASEASIAHSGGIALFYSTTDHLSVEELQLHSMNVARFQLASGGQQ